MWHELSEEENRDAENANGIVLNEKEWNRVMIHEQRTKAFESEHIMLDKILDTDDVTFELEYQVR